MLLAFTFAAFWAYIVAHQATAILFATVLVSSAITAGTEHPDVVPAHALHVLQFVLQLLSLLKPNAFGAGLALKLPLTLTSPPSAQVYQFTNTTRPAGFVRLRVLAPLFFACFFAAAACSLFKPSLANDEKACATAAVSAIEQQVAQILLSGSDNYIAALETLATSVGTSTVLCAVQTAISDFQGFQAVAGGTSARLEQPPAANVRALIASPDYSGGIVRGTAYLQGHGGS